MKNYYNIYICLFFLALFSTNLGAQEMNNTLYLMKNTPQSSSLNPAIQPECKVWFGFPGLSSIYLNYANSGFAYSDIIRKGTGERKDSLVVDINKFHSALSSTNTISEAISANIFTLGIRAKRMFFTLDVNIKEDARFSFDKDMIGFLKNGNYEQRGAPSNWGSLGINGSAYTEVGLGVSKKVNKNWSFGIRAKALLGLAGIRTDNSNLSVQTSEDGSSITVRSKQKIYISAPIEEVSYDEDGFVKDIEFDDDVDADTFKDNKGFAIDLGAVYRPIEKAKFYVSILDIGSINWKNTTEIYQDGTFKWEGGDWSNSVNDNEPNYKDVEDVMEDLVDSLKAKFKMADKKINYRANLPMKIYLGGTYDLSKKLNLGAISRTEIYDGRAASSLTLSANSQFIKNISTSVSYSIVNGSFNNLGFGLATKLGPLQFYVVSDNFMAAVKPKTARTLNARFGFNFLFGCKNKKGKFSFFEEWGKDSYGRFQ
ncbi:MAG: DUF5723 family protein [Marinifilaceae bacterium]|jgi:hypothetical protein|nr:DUF5723 family protein [Marinifilaceae bacterium]